MPVFLSQIQSLDEQPEREFETVINLDEMAAAGVRGTIEIVEGEPENVREAKIRQITEAITTQAEIEMAQKHGWRYWCDNYQEMLNANVANIRLLRERDVRIAELEEQANGLHELFKVSSRAIIEVVEDALGREMVSDAYTAVHRLANGYTETKARIAELEAQIQNFKFLNDEMNGRLGDLLGAYEEVVEGNRALSQKVEQAEAQLEAASNVKELATCLWEKVNARRCELIKWKASGEASGRDLVELAELQALADEYMEVTAPLPIEKLEAYMRAKGIEIPDAPRSAQEGGAK